MKSDQDTKVLAVFRTVPNRSVALSLLGAAFQGAVERAVQESLAESYVANDVATHTDNVLVFTVPVLKFVRNEVEQRSIQKPEMNRHRTVSNKGVEDHRTTAEVVSPPLQMVSACSSSLLTGVSNDKKTSPKTYSNFTCLIESDTRLHDRCGPERRSRPIVVTEAIALQHHQRLSEIFPSPVETF